MSRISPRRQAGHHHRRHGAPAVGGRDDSRSAHALSARTPFKMLLTMIRSA